ncbi:uncharacterized protein LOC113227336 [Hyposmocoma kahamanoa]|uniref:uncharacterized protein LOC113227336 n=1 Tax=Hyposmocoma kahamanoa TaxID=1477025 RepID=UPI000E6D8BF4|nr:uncharacterized protein LOC113227336 [Hyposmocoma kahamanoa]
MADLTSSYYSDVDTVIRHLLLPQLTFEQRCSSSRQYIWLEHEWDYLSIDENTTEFLSQCKDLAKVKLADNLEDIIRRSREFPIPFPIQTIRLEQLTLTRPLVRLKKNIMSTYPLIHERVLLLMTRFLVYKRIYGSDIEKKLYQKMTVPQLIDRILKKRAVTFYGAFDKYMLLTGKRGRNGWELVGTAKEKPPLLLRNCLSYDEMKLSSMVYVSGFTESINDGERNNKGIVNDQDIEENAVIIGIIGPRFKRTLKMEYEDIIISKSQNVPARGYGSEENQSDEAKYMWRKMWSEFYQVPSYSYDELKPKMKICKSSKSKLYTSRFVSLKAGNEECFDNTVYYKRLCVTAECILMEAEARAQAEGKFAFLNIIGAGLGKWRMSPHQEDVYVSTFEERIYTFLDSGKLNHVSDINFSYIKPSPPVIGQYTKDETNTKLRKHFIENTKHPKGGINTQFENREPSSKLKDEHEGKLLVMTYAWDGNAHPGNEFWVGLLAGSGDSAAACSTQVSELHNAHINPGVCANNTMIAGRNGVIGLAEYSDRCLKAISQNTDILFFQNVSWCKPDWPLLNINKETKDLFVQRKVTSNVGISDDVYEIIRRSNEFPLRFPKLCEHIRLKQLQARIPIDILKKNIVSTYCIVHERVLPLMARFLVYKREFGSSIEKALYKDMSVADLIDRILKKRAVVFMTPQDRYLLLFGMSGEGGWEAVGTEAETSPLRLEHCLSYDEMKLSSMVYVSGHTQCHNDGKRENRQKIGGNDVETDAVIIGIIGPRFERQDRMEYEDILITEKQNTAENGFGESQDARSNWRQMWAEFYQVHSPTYTGLKSSVNIPNKQSEEQRYQDRYVTISDTCIFDNEVYYKRLSVTAECVLLEAEARAEIAGKDAFVNVIGAGLGVWKISHHQADVFVLTFLERTRVFLEKGLINHVADVNFAYIRPSEFVMALFTDRSGTEDDPVTVKKLFLQWTGHPRGGINVQLENIKLSSKLTGKNEGKLLVMTYAWDGNAHPGNEFWMGNLDGYCGPDAAYSTQVAELHNAHINPAVNGNNTKIITHNGVMSISKYFTTQIN